MTISMRGLFRQLPRHQQFPLPPRQIATKMACSLGVAHRLNDDERIALARAGHFGYGTAMGMLYGAAFQRALPGGAGGASYGLGVWAASYLGWLPAAGVLPPATRMHRGRNVLMSVAPGLGILFGRGLLRDGYKKEIGE
jgi:hypothetical protein